MRNPGYVHLALPLALALILGACGASAPDDDVAAPPAAAAQDAGEVQTPPAEADSAPVPDPAAARPGAGRAEPGRLHPWAAAAQMGGSLQARAEGRGIEGEAGVDDMDAEARENLRAPGTDMDAFEALGKQ